MGFFNKFFGEKSEILWFIILFLLLFYNPYYGYGYGARTTAEK